MLVSTKGKVEGWCLRQQPGKTITGQNEYVKSHACQNTSFHLEGPQAQQRSQKPWLSQTREPQRLRHFCPLAGEAALSDCQYAPRGHPERTQKATRRHPEGTQEAPSAPQESSKFIVVGITRRLCYKVCSSHLWQDVFVDLWFLPKQALPGGLLAAFLGRRWWLPRVISRSAPIHFCCYTR